MMLKVIIPTLLIFSISASPQFKDCNFTDFRFQSTYNLGKQDQLNRTFEALNGKLYVPDIVYPVNSYTNYSLKNIDASLLYLDSKQRAEIMGNNVIVIDGGYLQTVLSMNWTKKDLMQKSGFVQALCKSEQILFFKGLEIQQGFVVYKVQAYENISFKYTQCKILRYQPAQTSQADLQYIYQLINGRDDKKQTAKTELAQAINKKYIYYLNNSLYDEKQHLDDHFQYEWTDQKGRKMLIQYQVLPTGVDLQLQGLSFTYVTEIRDYASWECGATIPHTNLDVKKYGGIQQMVSLSVFQNSLKYGAQAGALDTILNKQQWQSNMFQFYAGDLYEVMPYLSQAYLARQPIVGSCKASAENISIVPQQKINELGVRTGHVCQLFIKNTIKLLQLHIDLFSQVQARFQQEAKVNFYVKAFTHSLSYIQQSPFKIQNYQLANEIVLNGLKRILQQKTFGSGWPTYKMDYPHLKVMAGGYVVLYDTSQNGESQSYKQKTQ